MKHFACFLDQLPNLSRISPPVSSPLCIRVSFSSFVIMSIPETLSRVASPVYQRNLWCSFQLLCNMPQHFQITVRFINVVSWLFLPHKAFDFIHASHILDSDCLKLIRSFFSFCCSLGNGGSDWLWKGFRLGCACCPILADVQKSILVQLHAWFAKTTSGCKMCKSKMELLNKLTWLVLGGDPAARSHRVEQFTAL